MGVAKLGRRSRDNELPATTAETKQPTAQALAGATFMVIFIFTNGNLPQ
jgi:hypothetical protein